MLRSNSIAAIIGPHNALLKLVADDERIPYLTTSMSHDKINTVHWSYCYHMMPSISALNEAMLAIIGLYNWENTPAIYNKPEGNKQ